MYLARKYKLGTLFLLFLLETGPPFYVVVLATRRSRAICSAKGVPTFPSYFKTLSIGPVPGIEPATSRSAVRTRHIREVLPGKTTKTI